MCIGRSDELGLDGLGCMSGRLGCRSGCGSFGVLGSDGVGGVSVGMGCEVLGRFLPSVVVEVVISTSVSALWISSSVWVRMASDEDF